MSQVTFNNLEIAAVIAKAWDLKILDRVKSHSLNRLVIKKKKGKESAQKYYFNHFHGILINELNFT